MCPNQLSIFLKQRKFKFEIPFTSLINTLYTKTHKENANINLLNIDWGRSVTRNQFYNFDKLFKELENKLNIKMMMWSFRRKVNFRVFSFANLILGCTSAGVTL